MQDWNLQFLCSLSKYMEKTIFINIIGRESFQTSDSFNNIGNCGASLLATYGISRRFEFGSRYTTMLIFGTPSFNSEANNGVYKSFAGLKRSA